ncbi:GntR family transcriptional regulator [Pontivivens ytuae]|uniref:GntR family transcriptional regulator n=1 Tax=Pontivivens ytuae TaxID=2789856 RepID=A0A7S9QCF4_9RHOB|nr:GntR family transcriptional regulator [Pontivivens ytuae]QPH53332.1 GntR family transcriptional regulator [Pontivivens ytuae]
MNDTIQDTLSQGEAAYVRLIAAIRAGDYGPGDRLREIEIAERFSLSRTPIREALRRLESDGIVEHRPRIGAVIRTLSHTELVELYEMRIVLERTAAELAARHAVMAEVDELNALNACIAESLSVSAQAAALNQQFHQALYRAGRNRFLIEATRAMTNALLLLGPTTLADEEHIALVCRQHQAITDAIRSRDEEAAGAAAEAHLQTALRQRLSVMRA